MKRILLDTNAALWLLDDSDRLGPGTRDLIATSEVWVSAASVWEVAIKEGTGKLQLDGNFRDGLLIAGARELEIDWKHANAISDVDLPHRDPFDRLLVTQARIEGMTLVTADRALLAANSALTYDART